MSNGVKPGCCEKKDREGSTDYTAPRLSLKLQDFEVEKRLGDGSFSQVVQARLKSTGQQYALKIVDKYLIVRHKQTTSIKLERDTLDRLDYEGIVKLHFTFQDETSLYFGLELCTNGELFDQIQHKKQLSLQEAQFYAGEIVLILEYLRQEGIVHRDLKPENLLLTADGHLKLTDFGCMKDMRAQPQAENSQPTKKRVASLVGTADYVSPETLANEHVGYAADAWALGCLLVQMLQGRPPFKAASEYLTFQKVAAAEYSLQPDLDPAARDLISHLLVLEPSQRLGCRERGLEELKEHAFFEGIVWETLRSQDAPEVMNAPSDEEEEGLDWELNSMLAALPLQYIPANSGPGQLSVKRVGSSDVLPENAFGSDSRRT